MKSRFLFWIVPLFLLVFLACQKSSTGISTINLIQNGSFEVKGSPSLAHWNVHTRADLKPDAPPDGGKWALVLYPEWVSPFHETFYQTIPLKEGHHRLELTFFAKSSRPAYPQGGAAVIYRKSADSLQVLAEVPVTDTVWTFYQSTFAIDVHAGDTVRVGLHGGGTEVVSWETYFDLLALRELNP